MIHIGDLIFLAGVSCSLVGCWMIGTPAFLVGTGVAVSLSGVVIGRLLAKRRKGQ